MASFSVGNILLCAAGTNEGRADFGPDAITWTSRSSDKRVVIASSTIKSASWVDVGRSCQLWLSGSDGALLQRLEGFRTSEFERIAGHLQSSAGVKLGKKELSAKGRNFGSVRLRGAQLELVDDEGALVMPLPLAAVAQAQKVGASELEVECAVDDTVEREDEVLVDMRLYIPPGVEIDGVTTGAGASASSSKKGAGAGDDDEEEDEDADGGGAASALAARIKEAAGIRGASGDALVELPEDVGSFLVPRGRFSIELFPSYMRLGGSSYEFKVQYKSIARVTYLPIPAPSGTWADATRYAIVISLDDPLRQGNQRHPHLVLQLENRDISVPLNIPAEDVKAKRYEGLGADGNDTVQGMLPKVVGSLLKKVAGKPVFKPETFESATKQRAVRCTHKSQSGLLFPLDKSMMFIHKPTVWIRYQDVEAVEVQRYDGSGPGTARTWDLVVKCRASGGEAAREYLFQGLDRAEKAPLVDFFKAKGLKTIEEEPRRGGKVSYAEADDDEDEEEEDEDEEDDDFGSDDGSASSDDDDDDDDDEGGSGSGSGSDASEGAGFKRKRGAGKTKSKGKGGDKGKGKGKGKTKAKPKKKQEKKKGKSSNKKRKGSSSEDESSGSGSSDDGSSDS